MHQGDGLSDHPTTYFNYDLLQRKTNEIRYTIDGWDPLTTNTFSYSGAGDLLSLTDAKNQTTTWKYDEYGRVTNKLDASGAEMFRYAYDANGRLTNRWTPAKGATRYVYDKVGNLTLVDYAASTDISMGYDGNNRLTSMSDASGTSSFGYAAFGALASEDGPWSSDTIAYSYANRRRAGLSLQQLNASPWAASYGHDAAGRLQTITSPAGAFTYTYHGGLHSGVTSASPLVKNIALPNGAAITNTYEADLARLSSTKLLNSARATLNAHGYDYNELNQRTHQGRMDGIGVDYGYDDLGQLTSAIGSETGGTRWHERFGYAYDPAGNLLHRTNHSLVQSFGVNNLNQLTNQSRAGRMSVAGTTTSAATNVTVNTTNAIRYADHTFVSTNHSLVNGTNTFTAIAQDASNRVDTNIVVAYLPESSVFVYDANGNMVFDGLKGFEYDDENQLTRITATNAWKSEFTYDGKMRRRIRKEYTWRSGVWSITNEVRYIYDGNLEIQWRDQNNLATLTLTRGKDLSGSLQGAGGIRGLLAGTDNTQLAAGSSQSHAYFHADAGGNITMLINTRQLAAAKYLYDPFGNTLSSSGPLANANLYRFSSRECHVNLGVALYTYRGYVTSLQRWINRDPKEELGFETCRGLGSHYVKYANVKARARDFLSRHFSLAPDLSFSQVVGDYMFVANNPITYWDPNGLELGYEYCPPPPGKCTGKMCPPCGPPLPCGEQAVAAAAFAAMVVCTCPKNPWALTCQLAVAAYTAAIGALYDCLEFDLYDL